MSSPSRSHTPLMARDCNRADTYHTPRRPNARQPDYHTPRKQPLLPSPVDSPGPSVWPTPICLAPGFQSPVQFLMFPQMYGLQGLPMMSPQLGNPVMSQLGSQMMPWHGQQASPGLSGHQFDQVKTVVEKVVSQFTRYRSHAPTTNDRPSLVPKHGEECNGRGVVPYTESNRLRRCDATGRIFSHIYSVHQTPVTSYTKTK